MGGIPGGRGTRRAGVTASACSWLAHGCEADGCEEELPSGSASMLVPIMIVFRSMQINVLNVMPKYRDLTTAPMRSPIVVVSIAIM